MTRLSSRLVVQRVDDLLVILDQGAGAEITFDPKMRGRLVETIPRLFRVEHPGEASVPVAWMLGRPFEGRVPGSSSREVVGQVSADWDGGVAYADRAVADAELAEANRAVETQGLAQKYRLYMVTEVG